MQTDTIQIPVEVIESNTAALNRVADGLEAVKTKTQEVQDKQKTLGQQFKQSWTEINNAISVVKQAYQLLKGAVDETVGTFVTYAGRVREISQVTGQQAEEVSRLIQVTDDYKIRTETLNVVMRKMATEGMPLTIDSLAQLSDEYLKLEPGVERQIFLTEKFGRQGVDFAEAMLASGDALRNKSAAIADDLILTEAALKQARDYEIAQDNLSDAVLGLKIAIGQGLTPVIITGTNAVTEAIGIDQLFSRAQELGIDVTRNNMYHRAELNGVIVTQAELLRLVTEAEQANTTTTLDMAESIRDATTASDAAGISTDIFTGAIIDSTGALQQEQAEFGFIVGFAKQYETNLANVNTAEENLRVAEENLVEVRAKWPEGNQHVIDAQTAVDGLKTKLGDAQQASLDATNEMIAGFLQAQLTADGSFTEADIIKVLNYRLAVGLLTKEAYDAALQSMAIATNLANIPAEINTQININTTYTYTEQEPLVEPLAQGGAFSGWAMVGDAPGGGITPYTEWVHGSGVVYNQAQMRGQSAPPMASGGIIPSMQQDNKLLINLIARIPSASAIADALVTKLAPFL